MSQQTFSFIPQVVPQGDGSFVVKPGKPVEKLTAKQAANRAGCSVATIYRLMSSGFITGERPSPRKVTIDADSLEQHLQRSRDDEFWQQDRRRAFRSVLKN